MVSNLFSHYLLNPKNLEGFTGTEYNFPLLYAIKGVKKPSMGLIEGAKGKIRSELGGYPLEALWLAELFESQSEDVVEYFWDDDSFRRLCVLLNESLNGWALILGDGEYKQLEKLSDELSKRRFKTFISGRASKILENADDVNHLSYRETGLVYFAQLLVRYAIIYCRTRGGEPHEISHGIEEYSPGVAFTVGDLTEVEKIFLQGVLALGVPIISLQDGHGLIGHITVVESIGEMIKAAWRLPNIRSRLIEPAKPGVPVPVGRIFSGERLNDDQITVHIPAFPSSFIVTKPSRIIKKDTVRLIGDRETLDSFSVFVELGNRRVDSSITLWVEAILRRVINYAKGVNIRSRGFREVSLSMTKESKEAGFTLEHLGKLIQTELKNEFPEIGHIRVTFILDETITKELEPEIESYLEKRQKNIRDATEENMQYFYGCTRCQSFSLAHACTVTPERPAQCSKPWYMLKAYAVLAPNSIYNPCQLIEKGRCVDPERGEYTGVNRSTEDRTRGRVKRVYLHSIFEHPHTACSCFQNVAWYIEELDGIAVMDRGYKAMAPGKMTWTKLANMIAGRQFSEGAASLSTAYLQSPKFLKADGGYSKIIWLTESLKNQVKHKIPIKYLDSIATEKEATTIAELQEFQKNDEPK
jgi:acetyl-CoA decarbonylase/synthase complex subunit beta